MCSLMQDLHSRSTDNGVIPETSSYTTHANTLNQASHTDGDAEFLIYYPSALKRQSLHQS
jgi:hypothetical protein